jgi:hypothetical protein
MLAYQKMCLLTILVYVLEGLTPAFGESILINPATNNGSFELSACGIDYLLVPDGWTFEGTNCFLTRACSGRPAASLDTQFILLFNDSISQTLSETAKTGYCYALKVDYGNGASGSDCFFKLEAVNPNNSNEVVSLIDSGAIPNSNPEGWKEYSATSSSVSAAQNDWNLRITLAGGSYWNTFDNVRVMAIAPTPVVISFSPEDGELLGPQNITITCNVSGAIIRYTTDGSDPSQNNGTMITSGSSVLIDHSLTLKVKAWVNGTAGESKSITYTLVELLSNGSFESPMCASPDYHIVPDDWIFAGSDCFVTQYCSWRPVASDATQYLLMQDTTGLGSEVSENLGEAARTGYVYTLSADYANGAGTSGYYFKLKAINPLNSSETVDLIDSGSLSGTSSIWTNYMAESVPVNESYSGWILKVIGGSCAWWSTIDNIRVSAKAPFSTTVSFTSDGGEIFGPQEVVITCSTPGATIRYTTDGTDPTETNGMAITWGSSVLVDQSLTLKARAWVNGQAGQIKSATYTLSNLLVNESFEVPACGIDSNMVPDGWIHTGPGSVYLTKACSPRPAAAEGIQYLLMQDTSGLGSKVFRTLSETARYGYRYTLSAKYGNGAGTSGYFFKLDAVNPNNPNDIVVLIDSGPQSGVAETWNAYSAISPSVGLDQNGWNLRVTVGSTSWWSTIDNVQVTANAVPDTLILNGTMEVGTPPNNWLSSNATCESTTDCNSGEKSLKVTPIASNGYAYQPLTLTPNTPYRLDFWYKYYIPEDDVTSISAKIQINGVNISSTTCAKTKDFPYWTHMIVQFNTLAQVSDAKIVFAGNLSKPFFIDDVSLQEVPTQQTALQKWRTLFPGRDYICWQKNSCWDNLDPMIFPPAGVQECTDINVKMGINEYESKSFMITNLKDTDLSLSIDPGDSAVPIVLRQAAWVISYDNHQISDALPRLKGNLVIPSGESREVWLTLNTIPGPASQVLQHGDMEGGNSLSDWSPIDAVLSDSTDCHSGVKSLKIAATSYIGRASQNLVLKSDTRYRLEFWYKCLSGQLYTLVQFNGSGINVCGDLYDATAWTKVVREFETPGPANTVLAFCGFQAGDQVLIDDVSLREVTDFTYECIANGLMETGNPPACWISSGAALTADVDSHEGHKSLKITSNTGFTGAYQTFAVDTDRSYQLDFWYKGNGYVFLYIAGQQGNTFGNFFNATNWTHATQQINIPAGCSPAATLAFCGLTSGNFMIDEVSFKPSKCVTPVLPGDYTSSIYITPTSGSSFTINLNTIVYPVNLPERKPLLSYYWDFIVPDWLAHSPFFFQDMKKHSTNVAVVHPWMVPRLRFDTNGNRLPTDYTDSDRMLNDYMAMGPKFYLFFWNVTAFFERDQTNPPYMSNAWKIAFQEWLVDWVAHLQARGLSYDNFAMNPYDENIGPEVCDVVQLIKLVDPNIKVFVNSMGSSISEVDAIAPYVDVWCPLLHDYIDRPPYTNNPVKDEARQVLMQDPPYFWTYTNPLLVAPEEASAYEDYRLAIWKAWSLGMSGCGYWNYNYKSHWNSNQHLDGRNWAVVYLDYANDPTAPAWLDPYEYIIPGKRWEATREGVEDYTYLYMLKQAIANSAPGTPAQTIQAAQDLLNSLPNDILTNRNSYNLADQAKEEIINAIMSLVPQEESQVKTAGDANGDGMVDVGDLGILAANYGSSGKAWEQGDFNNDGVVDVGDLGILAAHYGEGSTQQSNFNADCMEAFSSKGVTKVESESMIDHSICSGFGLPLIAGLLLAGLGLLTTAEVTVNLKK